MTGKRGRPKKAGPRYPSGQRKVASKAEGKPVAGRPNPVVIAQRRALLGNPDAKPRETSAAENPLDCLEARGWIPNGYARAGHAYAELFRASGLTARKVTATLEEAPESADVDARRISDMTPDEIARVWSMIERQTRAGVSAGEGDPEAAAKLKRLWKAMGHAMCAELHSVCVLGSWPLWAMQMVCGKADIPPKWMRKRAMLIEGLAIVREVVRPAKPKARAHETERDHPYLSGPVIEEVVAYVDEEGRPDPVRNRAGGEVEVVRRRRVG